MSTAVNVIAVLLLVPALLLASALAYAIDDMLTAAWRSRFWCRFGHRWHQFSHRTLICRRCGTHYLIDQDRFVIPRKAGT